jgi:hypothetical protein
MARDRKPVLACFTMDVERVLQFSPGGGPASIEMSARAMTSYGDLLASRGFKATFFIVPNAAIDHAGLIKELESQGHECGMHFHANSFESNHQVKDIKSIGMYPIEQQRELLGAGKAMFERSTGFAPRCFRGGYFSANPDTYRVLIELGMDSGSTSLPGRQWNSRNALWRKAPVWIHAVEGKFIEVPVTSHINLFGFLSKNGDVRFEKEPPMEHVIRAVTQCLKTQEKNKAPVYHVCFLTHNSYDYGTGPIQSLPSKRMILESVLDQLPVMLADQGFELVAGTVRDAATLFRDARK